MKYYIKQIIEVGNRPIKASYRKMAKAVGYDHAYLNKVLRGKVILEKSKFDNLMNKLQKLGF